jgi:hypothetical protein
MKLLFNSLKLSEEELDAVESLSSSNYSLEKIAIYLEKDFFEIQNEFNIPDSEFRLRYDRGQLIPVYEINNKQKELALSGNITAAQIFLKESNNVKIVNIRNKCLFG